FRIEQIGSLSAASRLPDSQGETESGRFDAAYSFRDNRSPLGPCIGTPHRNERSSPMWPIRWLAQCRSARRRHGSNRRTTPRHLPGRRLELEALEDRLCPSYAVIDLGSFSGTWSDAYSVNEAGQVVGQLYTTNAFLWDNGVMTDLGTLDDPNSVAYDIN